MVEEARRGSAGALKLDALIRDLRVIGLPFTAEHAALAREAFRRFGKGRHPAALNFGDCMSYALAKERREPLLFKGRDFSRTDIQVAAY
jgi:ribonuclease VapC